MYSFMIFFLLFLSLFDFGMVSSHDAAAADAHVKRKDPKCFGLLPTVWCLTKRNKRLLIKNVCMYVCMTLLLLPPKNTRDVGFITVLQYF